MFFRMQSCPSHSASSTLPPACSSTFPSLCTVGVLSWPFLHVRKENAKFVADKFRFSKWVSLAGTKHWKEWVSCSQVAMKRNRLAKWIYKVSKFMKHSSFRLQVETINSVSILPRPISLGARDQARVADGCLVRVFLKFCKLLAHTLASWPVDNDRLATSSLTLSVCSRFWPFSCALEKTSIGSANISYNKIKL